MNVNIGGHHSPPLQHQQLDIIDNNKTKCCNLHFSTLLKLHLCQEYRFKVIGYLVQVKKIGVNGKMCCM